VAKRGIFLRRAISERHFDCRKPRSNYLPWSVTSKSKKWFTITDGWQCLQLLFGQLHRDSSHEFSEVLSISNEEDFQGSALNSHECQLIALRVPLIQQPCWKAEISRKVRAVQVISLHLQRQKPSLFPRKCPARMRTTMQTLVMKVLTTGHRNLSWRQLAQPRSEGVLFYLPSGKSHFFATQLHLSLSMLIYADPRR